MDSALVPDAGLLSVTEGAPTTRSGDCLGGTGSSPTVTVTALEQLLPVLASPATATTQAP